MTIEVDIVHEARACIVSMAGDIDMAVIPELQKRLEIALEGGCHNVVLDLSAVDYADSSALGLLVWLDHRLRPARGRLFLARANRDVSRILELSGLVSVAESVSMAPSVEAALEGLDVPQEELEPLWHHKIRMFAEVGGLAAAREEACGHLAGLGFPESTLFDIKVAVGEALANAVRHGSSPGDTDGEVRIDVIGYADRVVLEIMDSGAGFDGAHSAIDDPYAPGGRGIMFMRALMDRVEYQPSPTGGTLVRLTKHRVIRP